MTWKYHNSFIKIITTSKYEIPFNHKKDGKFDFDFVRNHRIRFQMLEIPIIGIDSDKLFCYLIKIVENFW